MKDTYYVIFHQDGVDRIVKRPPTQLQAFERVVQVDFEVDDEVFQPIKMPTIRLRVPTEAVSRSFVAEEVADAES